MFSYSFSLQNYLQQTKYLKIRSLTTELAEDFLLLLPESSNFRFLFSTTGTAMARFLKSSRSFKSAASIFGLQKRTFLGIDTIW